MRACGGPRRHRCCSGRTIFQGDIDLDSGVAAAIQDFPRGDVDNCGHNSSRLDRDPVLKVKAGTSVAFGFYSYRAKAIAARLRQRGLMLFLESVSSIRRAGFFILVTAGVAAGSENSPGPVPTTSAVGSQAQDVAQPEPPQVAAPEAKKTYQALIRKEAEENGLPPEIAEAVAAIESGYDPGAIGAVGEVGLMQVRP